MRTLWLAIMALFSGPALAQDVVATLYTHNGTLAPPYRRSLSFTVTAEGAVLARACKGYEVNNAACSTFTGAAPEGAVAAILAAARAAGLPGRPLIEDPMPPVGGGSTSGSVVIDGETVTLPPYPIEGDRERTLAVMSSIWAAIPAEVETQARRKMSQ